MSARAAQRNEEGIEEAQWQDHRLVVAHNPVRTAEQTQERLVRIHALQQHAAPLAGKLDSQDEGKVKASGSGLAFCQA